MLTEVRVASYCSYYHGLLFLLRVMLINRLHTQRALNIALHSNFRLLSFVFNFT
jgi:hypothetical protein